jgi:hypothetical protein
MSKKQAELSASRQQQCNLLAECTGIFVFIKINLKIVDVL